MTNRIPQYRHYKPKDLAVVRLAGRDVYLGKYGSAESQEKYRRVIAEWLANGKAPDSTRTPEATDVTINDLILKHDQHIISYYVKNDRPTSEAGLMRLSLRTLRQLYGTTQASEFGPLDLKTVRNAYIQLGVCRSEVNRRTSHVVRFFRWCQENGHLPRGLYHDLKAVRGLRKGRSGVREAKPVRPVSDDHVDAIQPHVSRHVWTMIELQRLTGMRPGEVVLIRTCDVDREQIPWSYTPESHKTEHHDRGRTIAIGPRARAILEPWFRPNAEEYLFSPREAEEERLAGMRLRRKTRVQPSQRDRHKPGQRWRLLTLADCYDKDTYARPITRACQKAFPHPTISAIKPKNRTSEQAAALKAWDKRHHWFPNQLRHVAGTQIRKKYGLDTARAVLGHTKSTTTEIYAERDQAVAADAIEEIG